MKTRRAEHAGFVLVFVVMIMGLVAVEMFVLTGISNTISFEADTAYLEACRENLTLSGLALAQAKPTDLGGEGIDLDISELGIKKAKLSLGIIKTHDGPNQAYINASCSRGRQTLRNRKSYPITQ